MPYKYCVISFRPDITAGELVHVGIELHDMDTKVLYKMYTRNVDEIYRRYGFNPIIPIVFAGQNEPPQIQEDKDYLNKKHSRDASIHERLFWSDVRGGLQNNGKCEDILIDLYDLFVLIDKSWDSK